MRKDIFVNRVRWKRINIETVEITRTEEELTKKKRNKQELHIYTERTSVRQSKYINKALFRKRY